MSRSIWKPSYLHPQVRESFKTPSFIAQNRSTFISSSIINRQGIIYNGIRWFPLIISSERVGNCMGQYAPTRKRPVQKKVKK